ncbi:hypothetical protein HN51_048872 [Arachis hypogaea]
MFSTLHFPSMFSLADFEEVADFACRINSDWTERMQDFLTSGRERTSMFSATNGNGYLRTGLRMEMNPFKCTSDG